MRQDWGKHCLCVVKIKLYFPLCVHVYLSSSFILTPITVLFIFHVKSTAKPLVDFTESLARLPFQGKKISAWGRVFVLRFRFFFCWIEERVSIVSHPCGAKAFSKRKVWQVFPKSAQTLDLHDLLWKFVPYLNPLDQEPTSFWAL